MARGHSSYGDRVHLHQTHRPEAPQFTGNGDNPRSDGGATVAPPSEANGKTWEWAARMVTGRGSCTSLEGIDELRRLAEDSNQPGALRDRASAEVVGDRCGGAAAFHAGRRPGRASGAQIQRRRSGTSRRRGAGARPRRTEVHQAPPPCTDTCSWGDDYPRVRADLGRVRRGSRRVAAGGVAVRPLRAKAQVARCRHGGGTVERDRITAMPVSPVARVGMRTMVGASSSELSPAEPPAKDVHDLTTLIMIPLMPPMRSEPSRSAPLSSRCILYRPASHAGTQPGKIRRPSRTRARASRRWPG